MNDLAALQISQAAWWRERTRELWPLARTGDLDATRARWACCNDEQRARLAATCARRAAAGRLPKAVAQEILMETWCHAPWRLYHHMDQSEIAEAMRHLASGKLRRGRFLRVYRGVADAPPDHAVCGLSWTTSLPVAAFYSQNACTIYGTSTGPRQGYSCVFEARVPADYILGRSNERREHEVFVDPDFFLVLGADGCELRIQGRTEVISGIGELVDLTITPKELTRWTELGEQGAALFRAVNSSAIGSLESP